MKISKRTIFIGFALILSASFTRQLVDITKSLIGKPGFTLIIGCSIMLGCVYLLSSAIKYRPRKLRILLFIVFLVAGALALWFFIKLPQVRMHILLYALLGWSASKDFIVKKKRFIGIILACIFCAAIGFLEELFQKSLPYRYYDNWDIFLNALGGAWGIMLYLIGYTSAGVT